MWLNLERTVNKRGRTAKKVITLQTVMTKKGRQFFFRKKIAVAPSVATPSDTNPSDATVVNTFASMLVTYSESTLTSIFNELSIPIPISIEHDWSRDHATSSVR